jgi:hypothetical protein
MNCLKRLMILTEQMGPVVSYFQFYSTDCCAAFRFLHYFSRHWIRVHIQTSILSSTVAVAVAVDAVAVAAAAAVAAVHGGAVGYLQID